MNNTAEDESRVVGNDESFTLDCEKETRIGRWQQSVFDWSSDEAEEDQDPRTTLEKYRCEYFAQGRSPTPFSSFERRPSVSHDSVICLTPGLSPNNHPKCSARVHALSTETPITPTAEANIADRLQHCDTALDTPRTHPSLVEKAFMNPGRGARVEPRGRLSWGKPHMQTLVVPRDEYNGSWHETTCHFNTLFELDLQRQRIDGGVTKSTLIAQFQKHKSERGAYWKEVNISLKQGADDIDQLRSYIGQVLTASATLSTSPTRPSRRLTGRTTTPNKTRRRGTSCKNQPIPPEQAHPSLPVLLFRCYHNGNQGRNTAQGFTAGRFSSQETSPPPPLHCSDPLMFDETRVHLDKERKPTPFISTTDSLINVILRGLRLEKKGHTCNISIINTISTPRRSVFYAKPYRDFLVTYGPPMSGINAWYPCTTEYLIWGEVPASAILHDFPLDEFAAFVHGHAVLRPVMRLHLLAETRPYSTLISNLLRAQRPVYLTPVVITGIADLLAFLGADLDTPPPLVARTISELVRGWAIQVDYRKISVWHEYSTLFVLALVKAERFGTARFYEKFMGLSEAFLWGVRVGLGERNWSALARNRRKEVGMVRAWKRKGLVGDANVDDLLAPRSKVGQVVL